MKVLITGLGDVGTQLAEDLSARSGVELVLIDNDEEKCETLSQELDALVINGDGTDPEILGKAGVEEADALVATTSSDALNMVIAILGKKFSVPKVVVKLNKLALRTTCKEIGVDHVISPKISAATEIRSLLYGYDILDFSLLISGGAKLTELSPGEQSGRKVQDLEIPKGTLIISILRDGVARIPTGDTRLGDNDILLILAEDEHKLQKVNDMFGELTKAVRPSELEEL